MGKHSEQSKKAQSERMKRDYASGKRVHHMLGKKFSKESREKMRLSHLGKTSPQKGKKKPYQCGKNHWNWKGGKSSYKHILRNSLEWKLWRESVFERDDHTCRECGEKGCYLEPHHIYPIRDITDSKLLFILEHGVTLCRPCHMLTFGKELDYQTKYLTIVKAQM